ncbi:MAG: lipid A biosynthesis acyltransferase [Prevotella sp.]|nr:lipid A biosynthesis acyltransferase [Prevotella sp.]
MHRWLIRLLRFFNIKVIYAFVAIFVIPVCLLVNPGRKVIYKYFREIWGLRPVTAFLKTYKNFCLFGQVVVDKFAMYAGKQFDIEIEGYTHFRNLEEQSEGFIQLSAHVGNYEIAGYTLKAENKRLNALVFGGEKETVMANRNRMFEEANIRMIGISSDMSHLFEINNALSNGEIVSMPADRMLGSAKQISHTFLGKSASFPAGPFTVATSRSLNVLAVNVMKTSSSSYKIIIAPLAYDKTAPKKEQIMQLSSAYVRELERIVRQYPEQWYNYYDFWA